MQGSYNLTLVFASYCVAVIAAYIALYFGARLFDITGPARKFWLWGGALCLGSGIWSMHFVGMSAYTMPMDMAMSFSLPLTILSWVPAVLASALALYVITRERAPARSIVASAVIMGAGISAMHYGGMFAMRMDPPVQYDSLLVAASIVIAVGASGAALIICRQVRRVPSRYLLVTKLAAALVMGAAICGMHYTGMAAASYPMHAEMASGNLLRGDWMGVPTAIASSVFLLLALIVAVQDFRQAEREKREHQEREAQVLKAAFHDATTGFTNRARFEQLLIGRIAEAGGVERFSLLYLELGGYRERVADRGEAAGADMARDFAAALRREIPEADAFARFTSSSFIVLTPALDRDRLAAILAGIKKAISTTSYAPDYGQWTLGCSHYPESATNSRLLIKAAQRNRYSVNYEAVVRPAAALVTMP